MGNVFQNVKKVLTTSEAIVYTAPAGTTAIVIGFAIAHVGATEDPVYVSGTVADSAGANKTNFIGKNTIVPKGSALSPVDGKLVLMPNETIRLTASVALFAEAVISVMEMS